VTIVLSAAPCRSAGLALLAAGVCALGLTTGVASGASGHSTQLTQLCGKRAGAGELVTHAGSKSTCAQGVHVMRAWRHADHPRHFRSFRCGEVPRTIVRFHAKKRWFATWQCTASKRRYRIWTRY
jgi:hypothetical protein